MTLTSQSDVKTLSFGQNFAVLNLDWMALLMGAVEDTPQGQAFISNCTKWNDAVHDQDPQPTTIFTTLFFSDASQPELHPDDRKPFTKVVRSFDTFEKHSPGVQIDPRCTVGDKDIVLQKTRWYTGAGNALEQILRSRNIDTLIISGLSLSGAVLSTIYHLADLDYKIYVISDNVLELPVDHTEEYSKVILGSLVGKLNLRAITIEESLEALKRS
ncbi:hypothetical protein F53441_9227 [Fusarium austroafricanum]|uniref:Isochorismatase-like domain-containing protein n=1 Tax=Fusarium austroafricanum TaxID=2364996 RepID=A0A8H4NTI2_9HYPO|nr:hypothetical protein F53441_9227 [Fusarium austroafricanum]